MIHFNYSYFHETDKNKFSVLYLRVFHISFFKFPKIWEGRHFVIRYPSSPSQTRRQIFDFHFYTNGQNEKNQSLKLNALSLPWSLNVIECDLKDRICCSFLTTCL